MLEPSSPKPKKLLDQLREAIRIKHYLNTRLLYKPVPYLACRQAN